MMARDKYNKRRPIQLSERITQELTAVAADFGAYKVYAAKHPILAASSALCLAAVGGWLLFCMWIVLNWLLLRL